MAPSQQYLIIHKKSRNEELRFKDRKRQQKNGKTFDNHHSQSNCYVIKLCQTRSSSCFFFKFSIKLFKRIHQNDNIRTTLKWTLIWSIAVSLNRQMLTEIFIRNINEKVRSSSWLFCNVSFKYWKCTRKFLWKILMGCTLIILHMIFSRFYMYTAL